MSMKGNAVDKLAGKKSDTKKKKVHKMMAKKAKEKRKHSAKSKATINETHARKRTRTQIKIRESSHPSRVSPNVIVENVWTEIGCADTASKLQVTFAS